MSAVKAVPIEGPLWHKHFFAIHKHSCMGCFGAFSEQTHPNLEPFEPIRAALMNLHTICAERLLYVTSEEQISKAFNLMIYKDKASYVTIDNWLKRERASGNPFGIPFDKIPQLRFGSR